ncbi:MAG: TonB-dependent receptor domain-containing protein [archaeon]
MKLKAFFAVLLFCGLLYGQKTTENFSLKGAVADESTGKSLSSASVSVLKIAGSAAISGSTTDEKGNFTIENIPEKIIRVRISMLGYRTVVIESVDLSQSQRLGLIKLASAAIVMPEIVIKSLKPVIEYQADRQVLNIDRLPGSTGSVTEALKNSGVVEVDPQSNKITVRGQDVKIQMDGHEYNMPAEMLAQMPASVVDQAEVILAPGAKESAEGGTYILNLISKKNTFDNFSGYVSLNTSTGNSSGGSFSLNYKRDNLNIFSTAYGNYFEGRSTSDFESYAYERKSMYHQISSGKSNTYSNYGTFKLGMDYDFNANNTMTLYGTYSRNGYTANNRSGNTVMNNLGQYEYGIENDNSNGGSYGTLSLNGFYKKKFETKGNELTFDLYYTALANPSDSRMNMDYSSRPSAPLKQNSTTEVDAKTFVLKTDYTLPINTSRIETGYSFTFRTRKNDYDVLNYSYINYDWRDSLSLSNEFKYKESINALYATYAYKLDKFDIKGGLRAENLSTEGNQYTTNENFSENFLSFFPNLNVSYKLSDLFSLGFNTFRRVTYPQIYYINPFRRHTGPNSYSAGNPKLKPYFVNSYAVSLSQYINVFYVYSTGYYTSAYSAENDSVMVSSYINLDNGKTFGVDLTLPYYNSPMAPFKMPDFISMLNVQFHYLNKRQSGKFIKEDLAMIEDSYSLDATLGLKLWYDVNMSVSISYRPATNSRIASSGSDKYLWLYFSKSFMKNKLRLNLYMSDPLAWQKSVYERKGTSFYSKGNYTFSSSRSITIGISYMFNEFQEHRDRNVDDGRDKGSMQ